MVCDVFSMSCNCNNVLQQCICTLSPCDCTDYVVIGEIAGNKYPVLLLFKYLGATLTENGDMDI